MGHLLAISVGYLTMADIVSQVKNLVPDTGLQNAGDIDANSSSTCNGMDATGEPRVIYHFLLEIKECFSYHS